MKRNYLFLFCLIFLPAMAIATPEVFPLATGTAWVYTADVKSEVDGNELSETLTWTTEINAVVVLDNMVIAKGTGLPTDLTFYEKGVKPTPFILIMVGSWRLYYIKNEEQISDVWEKAIKGESLSESVSEMDLLLDLPLVEGKSFGETARLLSDTLMFVYTTAEKTSFIGSAVKGLDASATFNEFSVELPTNSDFTSWKFAEGVGFTGFTYLHNGSTSEVNCKLVEFRPGK